VGPESRYRAFHRYYWWCIFCRFSEDQKSPDIIRILPLDDQWNGSNCSLANDYDLACCTCLPHCHEWWHVLPFPQALNSILSWNSGVLISPAKLAHGFILHFSRWNAYRQEKTWRIAGGSELVIGLYVTVLTRSISDLSVLHESRRIYMLNISAYSKWYLEMSLDRSQIFYGWN
jgi:hypothetical protein